MNCIRRGDIYYVKRGPVTACEQEAGRPAIVVSNDSLNASSTVVEMVFLTTQEKKQIPTHVVIRSAPKESTALCEQISSVSVERIGDYIGTCTQREMSLIESALLISLDLWLPEEDDDPKENEEHVTEVPAMAAVMAERDVYRNLYERLLEKVMAG